MEKKPHLVNWKKICLDKKVVGLGVKKLFNLNLAVLCKQ